MSAYWIGVDVGTGSARAGLFDGAGTFLGFAQAALKIDRPVPGHAEYRSEQLWEAVADAVRGAVAEAGCAPETIAGIGFDATCSLIVEGGTVSESGADSIVWMDHRATRDAAEINAGGHDVLKYVGGAISPEMQMPKLRWLHRERPDAVAGARFFDLPDWLTWKATGNDTRSLCSAVCKWTYRGQKDLEGQGWDDAFLAAIGLGDLDHARIGVRFARPGAPLGRLTDNAAAHLGLTTGCMVGASLIDAYAGALGTLYGPGGEDDNGARMALIAGTSACHIALTPEPVFVPGVWGPYAEVLLPGLWALEAGQSAAGALIDRLIDGHAAARGRGDDIHPNLDARLADMAGGAERTHLLGARRHVGPDVLGNRAPLADPSRTGAVLGLTTDANADDLALTYLAGIQALAHGTRQIVDEMRAKGVAVDAIVVSGGLAKSDLYLREHADACGLPVLVPEAPEPVLLGAAVLGHAAAEGAGLRTTAAAMSGPSRRILPRPEAGAFHAAKHRVFLAMQSDAAGYDDVMAPFVS